ncbi:hypothetical protein [Tepidibacillus fermentans]|uniref:Tetratricopeptide repeat protein n=1 Tax=Tepidibacillus fermentans TaxID=1281767 RepID=A0A4R3KKF7_9BACI|nr:hypothetical protein [Tepidibacillus fermentans]TCS84204.1 hypothetical protein EDD72_102248 [Tepidibacillus fermentans]
MDEQEYRYWVNHVQQVIELKDGAFDEFENWQNRALLSRILANMNIYRPAIKLMESILDEAKKEDEEHYVWALSDLANFYWLQDENKEKVLELLNIAINQMNQLDKNTFPFINKGFLYNQMWQILALAGDSAKVNQQIHIIIQNEELRNCSKTNSLLFYCYFNLALFAYERGEYEKTISLLRRAYSYSEIKQEEIERIVQSDLTLQRKVGEILSLVNRFLYFES